MLSLPASNRHSSIAQCTSRATTSRQRPFSCTALPVSPQAEGVVLLPHLSPAAAGVVELVALVLATALLAGSGKTTALAVLVDRVDDPVDAGVAADGLVHRVDADDLVVLVRTVLVDPVAVEHLYPMRRALSGRDGREARWITFSWRSSQQRTRSRKRITSLCFFFASS